jgi:hypothetical protein
MDLDLNWILNSRLHPRPPSKKGGESLENQKEKVSEQAGKNKQEGCA